MESLTEPLLQRVLRLAAAASGPLFMLDVVPRVCRRWRDAAREPGCWPRADVEVSMPTRRYERNSTAFRRSCRLLARARAIRDLRITVGEAHDAFEDNAIPRAVGRALRASRAVVQGVSVSDYVWENLAAEDCAAFVRLLERSKAHIRHLQVCIDPRSTKKKAQKRPARGQPAAQQPLLLSVVAQMPLLETLWININRDPDTFVAQGVGYAGELATMAATSLRAVMLSQETRDKLRPAVVSMMNDVLRCGAATLETVELSYEWALPKKTQALLAGCARLATLSAHPSCLGARPAMDAVRQLILHLTVDRKLRRQAASAKAEELVSETLARCGKVKGFSHLQVLVVRVMGNFRSAAVEEGMCAEAVAAFKKRWPAVDVRLVLSPDDCEEAYGKKPDFPFSHSYDIEAFYHYDDERAYRPCPGDDDDDDDSGRSGDCVIS